MIGLKENGDFNWELIAMIVFWAMMAVGCVVMIFCLVKASTEVYGNATRKVAFQGTKGVIDAFTPLFQNLLGVVVVKAKETLKQRKGKTQVRSQVPIVICNDSNSCRAEDVNFEDCKPPTASCINLPHTITGAQYNKIPPQCGQVIF
tara:strand:+ start:2162 stop:2602 length:441 start_codon:yes stop_codon:yes gene_type:complete